MSPLLRPSALRVAGLRLLAPVAPLALCASLAAGGCASDAPQRPALPQGSGYDRSEIVPSGLNDMRGELASQRSETISQMDGVRPESSELSTHDGSDPLESVLDAVGWAAERSLDVLSLRTFGLW